MKNRTIALGAFALVGLALAVGQDKTSFVSDKIQLLWETGRVLKTPESVLADKERKLLYVSNINGKPNEKDGNGFISRLTMDGKVMQLKWCQGLNAPKGMGLSNGNLYVADIDEVVCIDPETGKILRKIPAKNAKFLNDVGVAEDSSVYITDMTGNRIYKLKNDQMEVWLETENLDKPNGILVQKGRVLIGTRNNILNIDMDTKEIKVHIYDTGGIDGLVDAGDHSFITTDWQGMTQKVNLLEGMETLIDTRPDSINAADLEFLLEEKIMIIPTFNDNRVRAYKIVKP